MRRWMSADSVTFSSMPAAWDKLWSMSLPYHFGAGWFGGFLPLIATALVARTGNRYAGLYYPIAVTTFAFILSAVALKETRQNSVWS